MQLKLVAGANITLTVGTDNNGCPILTVASAAQAGSIVGYDTTDYATLADVPVPVAFTQVYFDGATYWLCSKNTSTWVAIATIAQGQTP